MWAEILFFSGFIVPCLSEYCTERYNTQYGYGTRTIHCSFGCCGSYHDQYCCVSNAGFIVGLVFAGIFVVSIVTALVCCCLKHKSARGRIIQPSSHGPNGRTADGHAHTQNNVFIVPAAPVAPPAYSAAHHPPPTYGYSSYPMGPQPHAPTAPAGPLPPAYSSAMPPPPAYTYTNPVFPTGGATTSQGQQLQQQQASPFAVAAASTPSGQPRGKP